MFHMVLQFRIVMHTIFIEFYNNYFKIYISDNCLLVDSITNFHNDNQCILNWIKKLLNVKKSTLDVCIEVDMSASAKSNKRVFYCHTNFGIMKVEAKKAIWKIKR